MADAYVIGNSPFYQAITAMAQKAGLTVKQSFNTQYETFLPQAVGHVLLIETHYGKPIVDLGTLERFFPQAGTGLQQPDGRTRIGGTTLVFLEFSHQLHGLT